MTDVPDFVDRVKYGDKLEALEALRDLVAGRLAKATSDRDAAALARRLQDLVEQCAWYSKAPAFSDREAAARRMAAARNATEVISASRAVREAWAHEDGHEG